MNKRPYPPDYPIAYTDEDVRRLAREGLAAIEAGDVVNHETVRAELKRKMAEHADLVDSGATRSSEHLRSHRRG